MHSGPVHGAILDMPISFVLQQQDQEEAADDLAADPPRGDDPVPEMEVEVERSQFQIHLLHLHPLLLQPPADTAGPSYTAHQSPEHIHVSFRELAAVMDAVCALATTQASLDQQLARAELL